MHDMTRLSLFEQGTIQDLLDAQLLYREEIYIARIALQKLKETEIDEPGSVPEDYMEMCREDLSRLRAQVADITKEIEARRDND